MPTIPELNQSTRMEYTSPVSIADNAGFTGQQIERLGGAVSGFGVDLAQVDESKKNAKRALDRESSGLEGQQAANDIRSAIIEDPNIKPQQYEVEFQKRYKTAAHDISKRYQSDDELSSQSVFNSLKHVENEYRQNLSQLARQESSAEMVAQVQRISSMSSAVARQDPSKIDAQIVNYDRTIEELAKSNFYDAKTALKMRKEGPPEIIESGIHGLVDRNQFDTANQNTPHLLMERTQTRSMSKKRTSYLTTLSIPRLNLLVFKRGN